MTANAAPDLNDWWNSYRVAYDQRTWLDYRNLLAETIRHASGPPLLDVGCGYGFLVECCRRFGIEATGLESSAHALAECRSRHPLADVRAWTAGERLPFEPSSFGAVMLNQVVDHLTLDENRSLFGDAHRVLRTGGVLLAFSPSRYNSYEVDTGHVTFFSPSEFRAFVEGFGFDVVAQPYHLQPVFGRSRLGRMAAGALSRVYRPEKWAATIDLVGVRKP
jgi:SAM-dependent methyltransferase